MNLLGLWKSLLMVGNKEYKTMNTKDLETLLTEIYKWEIEKHMKGTMVCCVLILSYGYIV